MSGHDSDTSKSSKSGRTGKGTKGVGLTPAPIPTAVFQLAQGVKSLGSAGVGSSADASVGGSVSTLTTNSSHTSGVGSSAMSVPQQWPAHGTATSSGGTGGGNSPVSIGSGGTTAAGTAGTVASAIAAAVGMSITLAKLTNLRNHELTLLRFKGSFEDGYNPFNDRYNGLSLAQQVRHFKYVTGLEPALLHLGGLDYQNYDYLSFLVEPRMAQRIETFVNSQYRNPKTTMIQLSESTFLIYAPTETFPTVQQEALIWRYDPRMTVAWMGRFCSAMHPDAAGSGRLTMTIEVLWARAYTIVFPFWTGDSALVPNVWVNDMFTNIISGNEEKFMSYPADAFTKTIMPLLFDTMRWKESPPRVLPITRLIASLKGDTSITNFLDFLVQVEVHAKTIWEQGRYAIEMGFTAPQPYPTSQNQRKRAAVETEGGPIPVASTPQQQDNNNQSRQSRGNVVSHEKAPTNTGAPLICYSCGQVDHKRSACPMANHVDRNSSRESWSTSEVGKLMLRKVRLI